MPHGKRARKTNTAPTISRTAAITSGHPEAGDEADIKEAAQEMVSAFFGFDKAVFNKNSGNLDLNRTITTLYQEGDVADPDLLRFLSPRGTSLAITPGHAPTR